MTAMESKSGEIRERAEIVAEALEEHHNERFRNQIAISVAVLAVLLAVASFMTATYVREVINTNIHANSDEALFHIKTLEQTSNELAMDELRVSLAAEKKLLSPDDQALLKKEIERYHQEMARLESEPSTGQGKRELDASRHRWEQKHHLAEEHLESFEGAEIVYQIAIVLCSVCIILKRRFLFGGALAFGLIATLLMVNGFVPLVHW
jgi:hypothetical protein